MLRVTKSRLSPENLAYLLKGGKFLTIPTPVTGWTQALVGSGIIAQRIGDIYCSTGATNPSSVRTNFLLTGFGNSSAPEVIDWTKMMYFIFSAFRKTSVATAVSRVRIHDNTAGLAALAGKGIGIQITNYAIVGESYGTTLGTVDLSTSLSDGNTDEIAIVYTPASKVEFFVNGVLKGTISGTASQLPGTTSDSYVDLSVENLSTGSAIFVVMAPKIWQAS